MKIFGMGLPELLIILAVVLLIFGPKHLPKLGAAIGSTVKNLRQGMGSNNKKETVEDDSEEDPVKESSKTTEALEEGDVKKTTRRKKSAAPVEE